MKTTISLLLLLSFTALQAQPCISNSNSLLFDGTTSYVDLAPASGIDTMTGPVTIEAWINASAWGFSMAQNSIFCTHGWTSGEQGFVLRAGGSGILSFNFAGLDSLSVPSSWQEVTSPVNTLQLNTWTHVAGTFSGTELKLYVNGLQVGSSLFTGSIVASTYGAKIGKLADDSQVPGRYFSGNIDEVRLWDRALSASELLASANQHIDPTGAAGLVGYWRLNEGSGTSVADLGSGSNAGTIIGANWSLDVPFNEVPPEPLITWNGSALLSSASQNNQWNLAGQPIIGANDPSYVPTQNGSYTVTFTASNGCTSTSQPYLLSTVGITSISPEEADTVWPNPASGHLYIRSTESNTTGFELFVFDLSQRLIMQKQLGAKSGKEESIDISSLPAGAYHLALRCGEKMSHLKFVVN